MLRYISEENTQEKNLPYRAISPYKEKNFAFEYAKSPHSKKYTV